MGRAWLPGVIYTPQQLADALHVHRRTVLKWIRSGGLKASWVGEKTVRITEEQLKEFLKAKEKS